MGYFNLKILLSPKSKEGCRVTKRQAGWLSKIITKKPGFKTYCMIKRLVLYTTK